MDPLISINTLSLEPGSFEAHVETVARIGAAAIAPVKDEVEAYGAEKAAKLLRDAGLKVALLTHMAFGFATPAIAAEQRERLKRTIDTAQAIGSHSVCFTSGGRGEMNWKDAAKRFGEEVAPCGEYARSAGLLLGLEPTSHLYADASIGHTIGDLVTLARAGGISVGMDIFCCWMMSDFDEAIKQAGPIGAFVQMSDYIYGDRGLPCRAPLGEGAVPVDRIVRQILATGYRGPFDLEVIGPRMAEDREGKLQRGVARLAQAIRSGMPAETAVRGG